MFSSKSFIVLGLTFRYLIHFELVFVYSVRQESPTFLAPGIGFMEDNFSTGVGWGREWDGLGSNASDGLGSNASNAEQQMKLC